MEGMTQELLVDIPISLNKIANQSRWLNDANFKAFNDSLLWKEPIHLCETDFKTFKTVP